MWPKDDYVSPTMTYILYNLLLTVSAFFLIPFFAFKILFTGKYKKSILPKLGFTSNKVFDEMKGAPRIWVHAVSVGEVTAAAPIISSLRAVHPEACIVISTSTETGQEMARRLVTDATSHIYFPLDIPYAVRKIIYKVSPEMFVLVETEIWPNFIRECRRHGISVVMVNGRISPRSFRGYKKTRFFWKHIMKMIDVTGVISEIDASRLEVLGVDSSKIITMGNAKYDSLAAKVNDSLRDEVAARLDIPAGVKVFVAGSTHEGEDEVVLKVYRGLIERYPDMIMIIVPRHPERGGAVLSLAQELGFRDCVTMKAIRGGERRSGRRIVVVDVIGELFGVYSLATVVFCGGSLVPKGGQNILEPAAWGKVVFHGPSMEDFQVERERLELSGGSITVKNEAELLQQMIRFIEDEDALAGRGEAARSVVLSNGGAAGRYADLISRTLTEKGSKPNTL